MDIRTVEQKLDNNDFREYIVEKEDEGMLKRLFVNLIRGEFFDENKEVIIDDTNRTQIGFLYNWATGNFDGPRNKGVILRGDVGTGKTSLLKATHKLLLAINGEILNSRIISSDLLSIMATSRNNYEEMVYESVSNSKILFIDDIGYEPLKIFDRSPIAEIIRERYNRKLTTCFSTNYTMKELSERYGSSFEDKVNEMAFIIKFNGPSRRQ